MFERLVPTGSGPPIWVDSLDYCQARILNGGPVPWQAPAELADLLGKANDMFASDAAILDIGRAYTELIPMHPSVLADMGARSRPGYALKTMLGDASLRAVLLDAVTAVSAVAARSHRRTVLSVPSPRQWLHDAQTLVTGPLGDDVAVDASRIETAAMYVADVLRVLAGTSVDGIVLYEGQRTSQRALSLESYRPVLNVAANYGWPVVHRSDVDPCWRHPKVQGVAASLGSTAPAVASSSAWAVVVKLSESMEVTSHLGAPVVVVVPRDVDPSDAMRWVARLRSI
jgi:hypothetical protein